MKKIYLVLILLGSILVKAQSYVYTPVFTTSWEDGIDIQNSYNHFRYCERKEVDRLTVINDEGARDGTHYARFEVRAGDFDVGSAKQERTEYYGPRGANNTTIYVTENSGIRQYEFSIKFDATWQTIPIINNSGWGIFWQLHPSAEITPSNPTFALSATDSIRLNYRAGNVIINQNTRISLSNGAIIKNKWIDWRVTVKYAKDETGYIKVERRDDGQSNFTTVLDKTNCPTLSYMPLVNGGSSGLEYFKVGLYRSTQTFTSILYLDNYIERVVTLSTDTPTVQIDTFKNITSVSTKCFSNVIADGGSSVFSKGVCWSTSPNPTIDNSKTTDGSGLGTFFSTISGLLPNTTYHIRSYATNNIGTGYSTDLSFTTSAWPTGSSDGKTGLYNTKVGYF